MDRCQQVQKLLPDYRTGILSAGKSAWLEEHLRECEDCANELRVLDEVLAIVEENTHQQEPPAGLWNGVYNRITSPEPDRSALPGGFKRWLSGPVRVAGVGVAVLGLAVGLIINTIPRAEKTPMQVASNSEYIQGHALYAGQAPFADRANYIAVVAASSQSSENSVR
jgi:anti-sigma-K factor RskA